MSFCDLKRGFPRKLASCCLCAKINKRSFDTFMCFDLNRTASHPALPSLVRRKKSSPRAQPAASEQRAARPTAGRPAKGRVQPPLDRRKEPGNREQGRQKGRSNPRAGQERRGRRRERRRLTRKSHSERKVGACFLTFEGSSCSIQCPASTFRRLAGTFSAC